MPELTKAQIEKIEKGMDTVHVLNSIIVGVNGNPGLIKKLEDACTKLNTLDNRITKAEVWATIVGSIMSLGIILSSVNW